MLAATANAYRYEKNAIFKNATKANFVSQPILIKEHADSGLRYLTWQIS